MEKHVFFESNGIPLEGLFFYDHRDKGVIIVHPHSLYGGNMLNSIVASVHFACLQHGISTLRFNFRGVGKSGGSYENGIGEQQDILAAVEFMKQQGISMISLVGYSFGAWVIAHTPFKEKDIHSIVMISPPVAFMPFQPIPLPPLRLVISGSLDDIAPVKEIEKFIPIWNKNAYFYIVYGADHFYSGYIRQLDLMLSSQMIDFIIPK